MVLEGKTEKKVGFSKHCQALRQGISSSLLLTERFMQVCFAVPLWVRGVMVAREILILFVGVRVPTDLPLLSACYALPA